MGEKCKISLVVADVDGTLVTEQKVLTERAQAAVQALHRAGVRFAITSGRPPRGMAMLFDALWGRQSPASTAGCSSGAICRSSSRRRWNPTSPAKLSRSFASMASMPGSIAAMTG